MPGRRRKNYRVDLIVVMVNWRSVGLAPGIFKGHDRQPTEAGYAYAINARFLTLAQKRTNREQFAGLLTRLVAGLGMALAALLFITAHTCEVALGRGNRPRKEVMKMASKKKVVRRVVRTTKKPGPKTVPVKPHRRSKPSKC